MVVEINKKGSFKEIIGSFSFLYNPFLLTRIFWEVLEKPLLKTYELCEKLIAKRTVRIIALQNDLNDHYFLPL